MEIGHDMNGRKFKQDQAGRWKIVEGVTEKKHRTAEIQLPKPSGWKLTRDTWLAAGGSYYENRIVVPLSKSLLQ